MQSNSQQARNIYFQTPGIWTKAPELNPEVWTNSNGVVHPVRPQHQSNEVIYKRHLEEINTTVSFRVIDPENDLDKFHQWHNQPRINEFWELAKPKEELKQYMIDILADKHMTPAFVEFDGRPVGYFEFYWVKEDRLGPYYDSDDYDRGFHFLIGEREALGRDKTHAVLKCNLHYLFLNDPRTRRVMAEPRHDNDKVLKYVEIFPVWRKVKIFDFPHKRAVLLEVTREKLFNGTHL